MQSNRCLASAWARFAANVGEEITTEILQIECDHQITEYVIEA